MTLRLFGHFSKFGLVFFVLKSLLGIARQGSPEKFAILFLNRMWAIVFQTKLGQPAIKHSIFLTSCNSLKWRACSQVQVKAGQVIQLHINYVFSYNQIVHVIRVSYLCCFFHGQLLVVSNLLPSISHRHPYDTLGTKIISNNRFPNLRSYKFALN